MLDPEVEYVYSENMPGPRAGTCQVKYRLGFENLAYLQSIQNKCNDN